MAVNAKRHGLALAPNHGNFPLFPAFQILEFSNMVHFQRNILRTTPLAFVSFQPFYEAVASIVLNGSCHYIRIFLAYFCVAAESLIVEQCLPDLAIFLQVLHGKIFSFTVFSNDSADSCPIFPANVLSILYLMT